MRSGNLERVVDAAVPPDHNDIHQHTRLAIFKMLVKTRYREKRAHNLFLQNLIKETSHLGARPGGGRGRVRASDGEERLLFPHLAPENVPVSDGLRAGDK